MKSTKTLTTLAVLSVAALGACTTNNYREESVAITTEGQVDLSRYAGRWFEIARFPNSFQKGCTDVTADYALRADGDVDVLNTCKRNGGVTTADAIATSNSAGNDKLLVDFAPLIPFTSGDYWILDVTDDYSVAVVGGPSGSVGWILAREPAITPSARAQAEAVLTRNGYDVTQLANTPQSAAAQ